MLDQKKKKSSKTVDLTLKLNVELEREKVRPKRVKHITSRKRVNLRESSREAARDGWHSRAAGEFA